MPMSAGDAVWEISGDTSQLGEDLHEGEAMVKKSTANIGTAMKDLGKGMTALGAGIVAPLALAVKEATSFQSAMANVYTLGIEDTQRLSDAVRQVAVTYGVDMVEAANAAYQAISAGATEANIADVLALSAQAATAGVSDLTTSIELGMGMVNAFGLEMSEMGGVFDAAFVAVKMGVTTFGELGANAGKASASFASAKLSVDEMFGAVAAMTKGNVGTAESFTQLNAVIAGFTRQGEIGQLQTLGLQGALDWLKETTGGNQQEMLKFLGSTEALNAMLMLTGTQADSFNAIMGAMAEKTGATTDAFNVIADNSPEFAMAKLKAQMQDLAITVGEALLPAIITLMDAFIPIIQGAAEWMKQNEGLTQTIVTVAAAVGAFLVTVGPLLIMLPGIATAVQGAIVLFGALGITLSGPVVAAIGAVVAAGAALWYFWDELPWLVQEGVKNILTYVEMMIYPFTSLLDIVNMCAQAIGSLFGMQVPDFSWDAMKGAMANALGIDGARAEGGRVQPGKSYIVGEQGPEVITPTGAGYVHDAQTTQGMMGGINVSGPLVSISGVSLSGDMDVDRLALALGQKLRQRLTGIGYAYGAATI